MRRLEVISKFFLALASSAFLMISGVMVPPLGIIVLPFVPQPVLFFGFKYGIGLGMGVLLAATSIFLLVAGEEFALIYGVFALVTGLLFALLGRVRSIEYLVVGIATTLFVATGGLLLYFFGSWLVMVQDFRASLSNNLLAAARVHEQMGFAQESLDLLKERAPQIVEMVLRLLPSLLFVTFCLIVLINLFFLRRRFPERWSQWFALENLKEWKGPEHLVWVLILCGFVPFIPGLESLTFIAVNVLVVIGACYFAQGLAIIAYFFHKNNVPRLLRGVTYLLIFFQQIFTLLVVGLGVFDLWGDFRRLRKKDLNPSQAS